MTLQEARQLLGIENSDPDELYEEKLFEYKNYFLGKVPVLKLFQSKLKRLTSIHEAYLLLGGKPVDVPEKVQISFTGNEHILETFQAFHLAKNELKRKLLHSRSAPEINELVLALVDLEKKYASCWFLEETEENPVPVSVEPDQMAILAALKKFDPQGGITFEYLRKNTNKADEILQLEMKRLSLLFKKY